MLLVFVCRNMRSSAGLIVCLCSGHSKAAIASSKPTANKYLLSDSSTDGEDNDDDISSEGLHTHASMTVTSIRRLDALFDRAMTLTKPNAARPRTATETYRQLSSRHKQDTQPHQQLAGSSSHGQMLNAIRQYTSPAGHQPGGTRHASPGKHMQLSPGVAHHTAAKCAWSPQRNTSSSIQRSTSPFAKTQEQTWSCAGDNHVHRSATVLPAASATGARRAVEILAADDSDDGFDT